MFSLFVMTSAAHLHRCPSSINCLPLSLWSAVLMVAIVHVISVHWICLPRHRSVSRAVGEGRRNKRNNQNSHHTASHSQLQTREGMKACVCVCGCWEVQTKGLWNIWMQVIALLTRVTSQINQTWWGDWCASMKRIKSQSMSRTSLALTYSHPERT